MKESKKTKKALVTLDLIIVLLEYYMGPETVEFKRMLREDIKPLIELIKNLSVEQKTQNIKLAKILKKTLRRKIENEMDNE